MRLLPAASVAALLLTASPALAGVDAFNAPVEATNVTAAVELDLYQSGHHDSRPSVIGFTSEDGEAKTFSLSTWSRYSVMSSGFAESLGLKTKKTKVNGTKQEYVVVDTIWLGADKQIELSDVTFLIQETPEEQILDLDTFDSRLTLNLAATGLAWSVSPSTGKVTLAPADQGASLVSAVGGTTAAFRELAPGKVKYGKEKLEIGPRPYVIAGAVGGQPVDLILEYSGGADVSTHVAVPDDVPTDRAGDLEWRWLPTTLGGVELGESWVRMEPNYRVVGPDLYEGGDVNLGSVGSYQLALFDVAVDPAGTIAIAAAAQQVRKDPRQMRLEIAEKKLAECLEPEEPLTEEEAAKPDGKRCASKYADLAITKDRLADLDGALKAWEAIIEANDKTCDNWQSIGDAQARTGDLEAAGASYAKAADMYHSWWDLDAYDRADAAAAFDKLDEGEQDVAALRPQPAACHTADGALAAVRFALKDTEQVASLYGERLDLDPALAVVQGSALILADDVEAAHGPWRMAEHLTLGPAPSAKLGLGRLFAQQGDWDSAAVNYEAALDMRTNNPTGTVMWIDDAAAALGAEEALTLARKHVGRNPNTPAAWLGVAHAAGLAGKDPAFVITDGDKVFADQLVRYPRSAFIHAIHARFLAATGRVDQAKAEADAAKALDPGHPDVWVAMAEVQTAQGKPGPAKSSYQRAVMYGAANPEYLLLIDKAR